MPHGGLQAALFAIKYLGWNARWVLGYRGTQDIMLAIDRGEIDVTSTGNLFEIADRLSLGRLEDRQPDWARREWEGSRPAGLWQCTAVSGADGGQDHHLMAQRAYDYWLAENTIDKVLVLSPKRPPKSFRFTARRSTRCLRIRSFRSLAKGLVKASLGLRLPTSKTRSGHSPTRRPKRSNTSEG